MTKEEKFIDTFSDTFKLRQMEALYPIEGAIRRFILEAMWEYSKLAFEEGRSVTFIEKVTVCLRIISKVPDDAEFETVEDFTEDKSRVKFKYK